MQPSDSKLKCQDGYELLSDQCYKLHSDAKSYNDALEICIGDGGHLIEPRSQADLQLMESKWGLLKKR